MLIVVCLMSCREFLPATILSKQEQVFLPTILISLWFIKLPYQSRNVQKASST